MYRALINNSCAESFLSHNSNPSIIISCGRWAPWPTCVPLCPLGPGALAMVLTQFLDDTANHGGHPGSPGIRQLVPRANLKQAQPASQASQPSQPSQPSQASQASHASQASKPSQVCQRSQTKDPKLKLPSE
jgi:hypothetical protein